MTLSTLTPRTQSRVFPSVMGSATNNPLPLGEQLVQAGLITQDQLKTALGRQKENRARLGELLVELGFIDLVQLLPFLERQLKIKAVRLRDGMIDPGVVLHIPRDVAENLGVLAMFKVHDTLTVAMTEPKNLQQKDELERITGCKIRPVFGLGIDISEMIERCYRAGFEVDTVTADLSKDAVELESESLNIDLADLDTVSDGSPIISLVNYIIVHAVRQGASDIHIEPGDHVSIVRYRVDGQLHEVLRPRHEFHPAIVSRIKVMARMDIAEHRAALDGRMHVSVEGNPIDLRVSTLPTVLGENVVLRVLDRQSVTFDLEKLGLPSDMLSGVKGMLRKPHGLVLVTGPTGSGKTTTLYSALELLKSVHNKMVTVEDPVEYRLDMINQVQADTSSGMTFASALRSILRQDPDIIMVGEIRDSETAEIAIQAALTGHLVLSTLHTNDSAGAVTRLLDMNVAPYKIAAALVGVIAQRLVRNICPKCKTSYFPPAELLDSLRYQGNRRRSFERGDGCSECRDTGYRGRSGVYEVMQINSELREIISRDANAESIRRWHREHGGQTLLDHGLRLAESGSTSLDEVARVAFVD
ncbi:GspE/PulE family protein [Aporhodopirellula aestuarii]|uniref:Flp pilus assembly complex ATPase component TadA n=1 Tax=Aporhodopirellula aestuarii TaxID=2950107 RepID=A0ABT0UA83_9BACT|nr:type II/IV secretion system protein [Aporhodopirellula aestuarii]MCM2373599.1 Flp pilus assembly complex ATPase component TadA [Aporhodopirellula aestuarii]